MTQSENTPVRLGIIGCGIAARRLHWPALQKLGDLFQITMVCNHTEPKARSFAELAGDVPYVLDYRDLLASPDVEAVDIVLPIHLNHAVVRDALRAGKHVLVEKPLAANLQQARFMTRLAEKSDCVTMVAENFRYRPTFQLVKEMLEEGAIGKPYAAHWNVFYFVNRENNAYARTWWRIDHQYAGGFITDGGVHNIHVFRYLFGEPVSGYAQTQSVNPEIGKPDSFSFQFRTTSGVTGLFNVYFSAVGFAENRLIILGSEGAILVEGNTIRHRRNDTAEKIFEIEDDGGYRAEFENFYRAIRYGKPVLATFQEGYRDLAVILGALRSAEKERVVRFRGSGE